MRKNIEMADPNSCLGRAKDDEFLFVLLARDKAAPDTIRFWVQKRIDLGKNEANDPQIQEALMLAKQIELEQAQNSPLR